MKAIDIVKYMIDNDLTKDELEELGKRLLAYIPNEELLEEVKDRM